MGKLLYFVSSNEIWGGSEILWSGSASSLISEGYRVKFATKYLNPAVQELSAKGAAHVNLNRYSSVSIAQRVLQKLKLTNYKNVFRDSLLQDKPELVVISQGNNVDGNPYMSMCRELSIPFVTITQLVTEILWTFITDDIINALRINYAQSEMNFFVSKANLQLHEEMMGEEFAKSKVVYNPFTVPFDVSLTYPPVADDVYRIALVARLETNHKGHDLLLKVLKQSKWRDRPVVFSFYGTGPHKLLLERLVNLYQIKNVLFKGHVPDVAQVWKENHLLILPSRMEGQSLALIEAMWCSRASVVTDVGGAKEILSDGESGFIAASATFAELDQALERAWQLRDSWAEMGRKAGVRIREKYHADPISYFAAELKNVVSALAS